MAGKIHFVSGKTLDISSLEFRNIAPKLGAKGIRCQVSQAGHIIPLNSTTMEYIELIPEEEEPEVQEKKPVEVKSVDDPVSEEKKPKTDDDLLNEMIVKSNCSHKDQTLFVQHTAKGVRYFPVCDFCGKRDRYISEKKVLEGEYEEWKYEDIENAKPWIDKD